MEQWYAARPNLTGRPIGRTTPAKRVVEMLPIPQRLRSHKKKILVETDQEEEVTSVGLDSRNSSVHQPLAGASNWEEIRSWTADDDGVSSVEQNKRTPPVGHSQTSDVVQIHREDEEEEVTFVCLNRRNSSVHQPLSGASIWDEIRSWTVGDDGVSSVGKIRRTPSVDNSQTSDTTQTSTTTTQKITRLTLLPLSQKSAIFV